MPYLKAVLEELLEVQRRPHGKRIIEAKSRQIMMTWFYCAMMLYRCLTGKAERCGWEGKKADDTDQTMERIYGMWERLPECVRKRHPCERKFLHIRFPATDSDIHGIVQDPTGTGKQVRQFTWSFFVKDEMAFQENEEESFHAVLPALGDEGTLICISTANPSFFEELFKAPMVPGSHRQLCKGMEAWDTKRGMRVHRLHWTADPTKTEEWADRESAQYGGRDSPYWRSEYEIDFGARRGGLVFPMFTIGTHIIPELSADDLACRPKYRVIDPGYGESAMACGWFTVDVMGALILYRELYKNGWNVKDFVSAMKAVSAKEEYQFTIIDPSAFAKTLAGGGRSVADLFHDNGIPVSPAQRAPIKKDQIPALYELMVVGESGEPRFKATESCENFVREILGYRWKEAREDANTPVEPVKRDDHLLDVSLYAAAALNPRKIAERFNAQDPLAPWYQGHDRRRLKADEARMRASASQRLVEYEP